MTAPYRYEPGTLYQFTESSAIERPIQCPGGPESELWMPETTPEEVQRILAAAVMATPRERLEITTGDPETGRVWSDRPESGYIGRSTGSVKIALMVHNSRSHGGPAILCGHVLRIRTAKGKRTLYQHPHFHLAPDPMGETAPPESDPTDTRYNPY